MENATMGSPWDYGTWRGEKTLTLENKWAHEKLFKFNTAKCNPHSRYRLGHGQIESSPVEKALGYQWVTNWT